MRPSVLSVLIAALAVAVNLTAPATAVAATGPTYVLPSATAFDGAAVAPTAASRTVTLPAHLGRGPDGRPVAYVVTESSDAADARLLGVNYAPKLANALGTAAVQRVWLRRDGTYHFSGAVDFSPEHVLIAGAAPDYFPPSRYAPGAVADPRYSPLVTLEDRIVRNAPQIANATGFADTVVGYDDAASTVTLTLVQGFYEGHVVQYIRTESSDRLVASVEDSTWAPNLAAAPGLASDDPATSAREAIVPVVNGPTGVSNPQRQGLDSALAGEGSALNVIQEEPADPSDPSSQRYSPVWDVTPAVWASGVTPTQVRSTSQVAVLVRGGLVGSGATGPQNPSLGLAASGAVSLCPVVAVLS